MALYRTKPHTPMTVDVIFTDDKAIYVAPNDVVTTVLRTDFEAHFEPVQRAPRVRAPRNGGPVAVVPHN